MSALDDLAARLSTVAAVPPNGAALSPAVAEAIGAVRPPRGSRVTTVVSGDERGVHVRVFGRPSPRYVTDTTAAAAIAAREAAARIWSLT